MFVISHLKYSIETGRKPTTNDAEEGKKRFNDITHPLSFPVGKPLEVTMSYFLI